MADMVDSSTIEAIVGVPRHATKHYGRAVPSERCVYILHSSECLESGRDLRECPYSVALDHGVEYWRWQQVLGRPVLLEIQQGHLAPVVDSIVPELRESLSAAQDEIERRITECEGHRALIDAVRAERAAETEWDQLTVGFHGWSEESEVFRRLSTARRHRRAVVDSIGGA